MKAVRYEVRRTLLEQDSYTRLVEQPLRSPPGEFRTHMRLMHHNFMRLLITTTLVIAMPLCCCVLRTAAALSGPEETACMLPSCCAAHQSESGTELPSPANDGSGCNESCCIKVPVTVDQNLQTALDAIAFLPEVMNIPAEGVVTSQARVESGEFQGEPPPDKDPTRSPRHLRRIIIIQR